ncbi:hypothetical protein KY290_021876 [Solanum tuberosum]|uniref:Uncharacterized protein n=1 Tax=Solanum tuberosum TaxID=4113 RepID=A0ABQ7V3U1_SOLTU|nr:hypothetical protein KY285_020789 [Solanum tuberosum]KAH0758383.1 hypothetical protein KY290_021876 [Solanum tuberosum]
MNMCKKKGPSTKCQLGILNVAGGIHEQGLSLLNLEGASPRGYGASRSGDGDHGEWGLEVGGGSLEVTSGGWGARSLEGTSRLGGGGVGTSSGKGASMLVGGGGVGTSSGQGASRLVGVGTSSGYGASRLVGWRGGDLIGEGYPEVGGGGVGTSSGKSASRLVGCEDLLGEGCLEVGGGWGVWGPPQGRVARGWGVWGPPRGRVPLGWGVWGPPRGRVPRGQGYSGCEAIPREGGCAGLVGSWGGLARRGRGQMRPSRGGVGPASHGRGGADLTGGGGGGSILEGRGWPPPRDRAAGLSGLGLPTSVGQGRWLRGVRDGGLGGEGGGVCLDGAGSARWNNSIKVMSFWNNSPLLQFDSSRS